MASYIDWYLVELESRLRRRLPPERLHIVLSETSEHLIEKSSDLVAAGMDAEAADRASVREFGSPSRVAFGLLEGPVSKWRAGLGTFCVVAASLMVLLTATAYCAVGEWASFGMWANFAAPISVFLVLAAACLARRSQGKVILACAIPIALLSGWIMSGNLVFRGVVQPRDRITVDRFMANLEADDLRKELAVLERGIRHYGLSGVKDPAAAAPRGWHGDYVLLPRYVHWQFNPRELGIERKPGWAMAYREESSTTRYENEARENWASNARWILQSTSNRLAVRSASITEEDALLAKPPTHSAPLFLLGVGLTAVPAVLLWLVNLLSVQLARLLRWAAAARPRLVA